MLWVNGNVIMSGYENNHSPDSGRAEAMKNAPVAVARSNGNYFSIAMETIQADSLIYTLVGWIFPTATRYSIQL